MKTLDSSTIAEKNKASNRPITLYKIYAFDGTNNLYYAESKSSITFNGQLYTAFPITHDIIEDNSTGQTSEVKLRVSNISRLIQAYLEAYDLRTKRVDIISVWADKLDDADNKIVETFYIDNYTSNERDVEFSLSNKLKIIELPLPSGKYLRTHCRFKFKGAECAYAGAQTSCDRTFQRCKELLNFTRFGGFPSIPFRNVYVTN